jgi:FMN phosphatase YigB (HAD superfamily)
MSVTQVPEAPDSIVFLVDVDNTLLDNDAVRADFQRHLEHAFGPEYRERYWTIQEDLFLELGYRDYLGAVQRFRVENPFDVRLLSLGAYFMNYPFADRLFPGAIDVLQHLRAWGPTVILSDGDAVFQPRKVERAGLAQAVNGDILIYIHKEEALADIERRYPADRYVLVDDKLQILTAAKRIWGERVTTIFPRQGALAHDAAIIASNPPADVTVEHLRDLLSFDLPALLASR